MFVVEATVAGMILEISRRNEMTWDGGGEVGELRGGGDGGGALTKLVSRS